MSHPSNYFAHDSDTFAKLTFPVQKRLPFHPTPIVPSAYPKFPSVRPRKRVKSEGDAASSPSEPKRFAEEQKQEQNANSATLKNVSSTTMSKTPSQPTPVPKLPSVISSIPMYDHNLYPSSLPSLMQIMEKQSSSIQSILKIRSEVNNATLELSKFALILNAPCSPPLDLGNCAKSMYGWSLMLQKLVNDMMAVQQEIAISKYLWTQANFISGIANCTSHN